MKRTLYLITLLILSFGILISQNIFNSADVKLKAPLKQDWSFKTDGYIINQKIIGDICYVNTHKAIQAISLIDGKLLWSYPLPNDPVFSTIVTFSDKFGVYISYDYNKDSKKGTSTLTLVDLSTGKDKWSLKSNEILHKPAAILNDQNVFCIVGPPDKWKTRKDYFETELDKAKLTSFSINNGSKVWETKLSDEGSNIVKTEGEYIFVNYDFDVSKEGAPKNKILCFSTQNGEELWDYNPSGMLVKASIGDVKIHNNVVYSFPPRFSNGTIAELDLKKGKEKWYFSSGCSQFFFYNDILYGFSSFQGFVSWIGIDIVKGEKTMLKNIKTASFSFKKLIGGIAGNLLKNTPLGGIIALTLGATGALVDSFLPADEKTGMAFIPTRFLFSDLCNMSILNDKGLFCLYYDEEKPVLAIMNLKIGDENKIEYKIDQKMNDMFLANGTSESSIFIAYKGKVSSINISTGKEEWTKEFDTDPGILSLGLIIKGDKMYWFNTSSVVRLSNEN